MIRTLLILVVLSYASVAMAADVTFSFTLSDTEGGQTGQQKAVRLVDALIGLYGSALPVDDPDTPEWEGAFDNPETEGVNEKWSESKKARYLIRGLWLRDVRRYERMIAQQQHVDTIDEDELLVNPVDD